MRRLLLAVPPAMRYPKYRAYWSGFLVSVAGYQVFQFIQFVLVFELTGSVLDLGFLGFANALPPILLGVFGGVFADRWDKRKLILATQLIVGSAIFILAVLTQTRLVEPWHVVIVAVIASGVGAFDSPARSAFYPRLIPRSAMVSAVALNSTIWQFTRIVGPALGGLIAGSIGSALDGIAAALFVSAAGYVAMIVAMLWLRVSAKVESRGNPLHSLVEGLRYIRSDTIVFFLISMAFATSFFGWSFMVLMPVFATDVLGVGKVEQGVLLSAAGLGATVVTVALSVVDSPFTRRRGLFVIGGAVGFGGFLAAFALTSDLVGSYPLAVVLMFGLGVTQMTYTTGTMGAIQLTIPDQFRGRVLGVYGMVWGIQPLAGTQAAFLARFMGVPMAVALGGIIISALALGTALLNPTIRSLRVAPRPEKDVSTSEPS